MGLGLLALLGVGLAALLIFDDDDDSPRSSGPVEDVPDTVEGSDGDDTLTIDGNDFLQGLEGDDSLSGSDTSTVEGGTGQDTITLRDNAVGIGGDGDDGIFTGDQAAAFGGTGDDVIVLNGNSTGEGGEGGEGNDGLKVRNTSEGFGGAGDDTLKGGEFSLSEGGSGNDSILLEDLARGFGGEGDDTLSVGSSGSGEGNAGDDVLVSFNSAEIFGNEGNDKLTAFDRSQGFGGEGDDNLRALDRGQVFGEAGDDTVAAAVISGLEDVLLSGGEGTDEFLLQGRNTFDEVVPNGQDPSVPRVTITDFDPATEVIILENLEEDTVTFNDTGTGDTEMVIANADASVTVLLQGVTASQMSSANVISRVVPGETFTANTGTVNGTVLNDTFFLSGDALGFGFGDDDTFNIVGNATGIGGQGDNTLIGFATDSMDDVNLTGGEGTDQFELAFGALTFDLLQPNPAAQEPSITITDFDPTTEVITAPDFAGDSFTLVDTGDGNTDLVIEQADGDGFKVRLLGVSPADIPASAIQA